MSIIPEDIKGEAVAVDVFEVVIVEDEGGSIATACCCCCWLDVFKDAKLASEEQEGLVFNNKDSGFFV